MEMLYLQLEHQDGETIPLTVERWRHRYIARL